MKTINSSIKGKICVLGGSFEATRLVPYFNKKPKTTEKVTIKIMANYVYSLKGIFSRDSVKPYLKNFKVKLITNNFFQIDNDEIDYMKEVMGDDFEYKCIENVWSNMFLKEGSPCVTLDLYGFGYNPYSYHGNSIEESNRGLCIKIDNKNISQELSDWFDLIWENEKMISLSSIIVKSKDISKIVGKDGGGRMFSFANVEFSNVIDSNQSILEIDFSKFLLKDVNSDFIPTKAKLMFYDKKVVLSYNDETNENLCVTFFDELVLDYIFKLVDEMGVLFKAKPAKNMDYLLHFNKIYSHQLYAYLKLNIANESKVKEMHEHYVRTNPLDGERKFKLTLDKVK